MHIDAACSHRKVPETAPRSMIVVDRLYQQPPFRQGNGHDASRLITLFPAAVFVTAGRWLCKTALHSLRLARWWELELAVRDAIDG